jgi:hypothetical protein
MRYLDETFPGLPLNPPLFYRWPVGLRFDLGGRASTADERDEVLNRATTLFKAAFSEDDSCIVVAQDWSEDHRSPGLSHAPALFEFSRGNAIGLHRPEGQVEAPDPEEPEIGLCTLTWVEQPVRHSCDTSWFLRPSQMPIMHGIRPLAAACIGSIDQATSFCTCTTIAELISSVEPQIRWADSIGISTPGFSITIALGLIRRFLPRDD